MKLKICFSVTAQLFYNILECFRSYYIITNRKFIIIYGDQPLVTSMAFHRAVVMYCSPYTCCHLETSPNSKTFVSVVVQSIHTYL